MKKRDRSSSPDVVGKKTSLSKILRNTIVAPTVIIGEKQFDLQKEIQANETVARLFPMIMINTDPDGMKYIPVLEINKMEQVFEEQKREAYQKGLKTGHDRGRDEGLAKAREVLQQFNKAIEDAVVQRESLLQEAKQKVLNLVLQVSRKVTFDAISVDPEKTQLIIAGVIDSLIDRSKLKIKVNPDYLPIIEQNIDRFLEGCATIKELSIEADPRVHSGGCLIETPSGDIDARLESQFDVVSDAILTGTE